MSRISRWAAREVASGLAAPVTNRIADGYDFAKHGYDTAGQVDDGMRGLTRSSRRRGSTVVGGEWFHGGGDRKNALAQIGTDFATLKNDLAQNATISADAAWVVADVAPIFAEWQGFIARMAASPLAAYVTEWSVFESWMGRLVRLREAARARGIKLASPEPTPLPQTVWQRGANGTGSSLDVWLSLGKTTVFGVIALTGVIAFYSISKDLHAVVKRRMLARRSK